MQQRQHLLEQPTGLPPVLRMHVPWLLQALARFDAHLWARPGPEVISRKHPLLHAYDSVTCICRRWRSATHTCGRTPTRTEQGRRFLTRPAPRGTSRATSYSEWRRVSSTTTRTGVASSRRSFRTRARACQGLCKRAHARPGQSRTRRRNMNDSRLHCAAQKRGRHCELARRGAVRT